MVIALYAHPFFTNSPKESIRRQIAPANRLEGTLLGSYDGTNDRLEINRQIMGELTAPLN